MMDSDRYYLVGDEFQRIEQMERMNLGIKKCFSLVFLLVFVTACSGATVTAPKSIFGANADSGSGDGSSFNPGGSPDTLAIVWAQDNQTEQDGQQTRGGGGGGTTAIPECENSGELFCPCADNGDCDSGWCVEGPDGNICTQECISDCPEGFVCRQIAGGADDVLFLCVFPYARLCRPCTADSECSGNGGSLGDRCVNNGVLGQTCGVGCNEDMPCPDDYLCAEVMTTADQPSRQCVPKSGECPCTDVLKGQSMECTSASAETTCKGERLCSEGAWSDCTAPEVAAAHCDGLDNDCDGLVDEEGESNSMEQVTCGDGICEHQMIKCVDGTKGICDPFLGKETELCDALDNDCDGFTDEDWDGIGEPCDVHEGEPDFCATGEMACRPNGLGTLCVGDNVTFPELCNGEDDDCDGETDEAADLGEQTCGLGICAKTVPNCVDGELVDCEPLDGAEDEDFPDDQFLDSNCDGIDGEIEGAIFVDEVNGNKNNPGTMDEPLKSLQSAMELAAQQGKRDVYVSTGFYPESLVLKNGVSVYGLYSADSGWTRASGNTVSLSGGTTAVLAEGIQTPTTLEGLVIKSANAGNPGKSSIGIRAKDSPELTLRRLDVFAGNGAKGQDGENGSPAADGGDGGIGENECEDGGAIFGWGCGSCSRPQGGALGSNPECSASGAKGGNGGSSGSSGSAGNSAAGGASGGNAGGSKGGAGGAGQGGGTGSSGSAGLLAQLSADGPVLQWAGDGVDGTAGKGGGGGGGGRGDSTCCCDNYGAGGGGGGAGGCGGKAGKAGGGAGSSFGIYLWNSASLVDDVNISTGAAGQGGSGGMGGEGGEGGAGGAGGVLTDTSENAGVGGAGGQGGAGGAGGHGGGGAGGYSIGIYCGGTGQPILDNFSLAGLGSGGPGGVSAGNAGMAGQAVERMGCPAP